MRRCVQIALFLTMALAGAVPGIAKDLYGSGQSVVDGDEFVLCEGTACMNIRLCGIDTPSKGQPGYENTISALQELVVGQKVVCRPVNEGSVCDGISGSKSRGRTIAQCFVQQATIDLAGSLISAGLGCDRPDRSGGFYSKDHPDWQCKN
jgi:endonuclease YncB( thermonuclease family)